MRLADKITARTDELIAAAKKGGTEAIAFYSHLATLRGDAYLAYLDGKVARAKVLNREADRLSQVVGMNFSKITALAAAAIFFAGTANATLVYRVEVERNEFIRMTPLADDVFRIEIERAIIKIEEPVEWRMR